jgi:TPP-dependent pyruvate/acetoin dehydrogenase alpha subunit
MPLYRVLQEDGTVVGEVPALADSEFLAIYRAMVTTRAYDEQVVRLQRQGRVPLHVQATGEEAVGTGTAAALAPDDWLFTYYRSASAWFMRGVDVTEVLDEQLGNKDSLFRGTDFGASYGSRKHRIFPHISAIATHLPIAVGYGMAATFAGEKTVVAATFGDGATSRGDFHEAMNFAGVFKAPVVFVCQNDQWAISVPYARQTAAESIASKAQGYGFEGVQVDGNDVLAVYAVVRSAAEKARTGGGPTLVEALTYRLGPHSTSDDPSKYRDQREVDEWKAREPIARFRRFLVSRGILTDETARQLDTALAELLRQKSRERMQVGNTPPDEIFSKVYSEVPWHLDEELDRVRKKQEEG